MKKRERTLYYVVVFFSSPKDFLAELSGCTTLSRQAQSEEMFFISHARDKSVRIPFCMVNNLCIKQLGILKSQRLYTCSYKRTFVLNDQFEKNHDSEYIQSDTLLSWQRNFVIKLLINGSPSDTKHITDSTYIAISNHTLRY